MQECGHDTSYDALLLSRSLVKTEDSSQAERDKVMLVYDDRLVEHREGKRLPHPERPDRISAVIARLMQTGLAGMHKSDAYMMVDCDNVLIVVKD